MAKAVDLQRRYESVFIFTPSLSKEQVGEAIQKYKDFLAGKKASLVHEYPWGMRDLAYPIQRKKNGYYYLLEYDASPSLIASLEVEIRRDDSVLRALTTLLDKHAMAYNLRQRTKAEVQESEGEAGSQEVSSAEVPTPKPQAVKGTAVSAQPEETAESPSLQATAEKKDTKEAAVKDVPEEKQVVKVEVEKGKENKAKKDESKDEL